MAFTNYLEEMQLNHTLGVSNQSGVRPAAIHLGFFTSTPGESGSFASEVTNSVRQAISFNAPSSLTGPPSGIEVSGPITGIADIPTTGWDDAADIPWMGLIDDARNQMLLYDSFSPTIAFTGKAGTPLDIDADQIKAHILNNSSAFRNMTTNGATIWWNHIMRAADGGAAMPFPTTVELTIHNGDPADVGNNIYPGTSPIAFDATAAVQDGGAGFAESFNNTLKQFSGVAADTLTHWGIWVDGTFFYVFDQNDVNVGAGSDLKADPNTLRIAAN